MIPYEQAGHVQRYIAKSLINVLGRGELVSVDDYEVLESRIVELEDALKESNERYKDQFDYLQKAEEDEKKLHGVVEALRNHIGELEKDVENYKDIIPKVFKMLSRG